jgi:hypothetical protein
VHSIDEANREARRGCYPELDLPEPQGSGSATTYEPGPVCGAQCTEDINCGYDGCTEPTGSQTVTTRPPPPRQVSTYHACDPEEPMELPAYGCDYLEPDYAGNVRCAG